MSSYHHMYIIFCCSLAMNVVRYCFKVSLVLGGGGTYLVTFSLARNVVRYCIKVSLAKEGGGGTLTLKPGLGSPSPGFSDSSSSSGFWYFFRAAPTPRGQKHPAPAPWQNILLSGSGSWLFFPSARIRLQGAKNTRLLPAPQPWVGW